jgi:hypothetical protein
MINDAKVWRERKKISHTLEKRSVFEQEFGRTELGIFECSSKGREKEVGGGEGWGEGGGRDGGGETW